MVEEWKPVVGWEGYYEVSNKGRVRSLERITSQGQKMKGRVRKQSCTASGHLVVPLCRDGQKQLAYTHRLVLLAFRGKPSDGAECCHCDGDPTNNNLSNLRWDNHKANMQDKIRHGRQPRGEGVGNAKLTEHSVVRAFELRANGMTHQEIASHFGVTGSVIRRVLVREIWSHVEIPESLLSAVEALQGQARGGRHAKAKLTEADVLQVYCLRKAGYRYVDIAKMFNMDASSIHNIISGRSWSHLFHLYQA